MAKAKTGKSNAIPKVMENAVYQEVGIDVIKFGVNLSRYQQSTEDTAEVKTLVTALQLGRRLPPITLYKNEDGYLELIAGNNRYLAHKANGNETISAHIITDVTSPADLLSISLEENLNRKSLTVVDQAYVINRMNNEDMTQQAIANVFNRSQAWVSQKLQLWGLLERLPFLIEYVEQGKASEDILLKMKDKTGEEIKTILDGAYFRSSDINANQTEPGRPTTPSSVAAQELKATERQSNPNVPGSDNPKRKRSLKEVKESLSEYAGSPVCPKPIKQVFDLFLDYTDNKLDMADLQLALAPLLGVTDEDTEVSE